MARINVLFPVPDSPIKSTFSPAVIVVSASSIMTLPSCCATARLSRWMFSSVLSSMVIRSSSPVPTEASRSEKAVQRPATRPADASHSAMRA